MKKSYLFALIALLMPAIAYAASEYATFESFFKESFSMGLWGWAIAALVAVAAGAAIIVSGGTASPLVAGIGTWVGSMMGLSGIAATNAGLALLGGGAIAAGGFGMLGGTAVITAALTFGTGVVMDYSVGGLTELHNQYKYSQLIENSKNMPTLPLPLNDKGALAYKNAMKELAKVDADLPVSFDSNQRIIQQAIQAMEKTKDTPSANNLIKNETLLALLYFNSNNYSLAKMYANGAIINAKKANTLHTLPAFIYGTSNLYDEKLDFFNNTREYFYYAVLSEPKNPLIPLLFSVYLDRMMLRFDDGAIDERAFKIIFHIMQDDLLEDKRELNYTILLSRYFIRLKIEQQRIASLTTSSNSTIKDNAKTLEVVTDSLARYKTLNKDVHQVMRHFLALKEKKDDKQSAEFHKLSINYVKDEARLQKLVDDLAAHQKKSKWKLW